MPQEEVVDITVLEPIMRRVFPAARSVSLEPVSSNGLLAVYRVRADDTICYLRVAEEAGQDLATDARLLASLAGLGVRVPEVVHVESDPGDLDRSFLIVTALDGDSLACHGRDAQARHAARAAGRDSALISTPAGGWLRLAAPGRVPWAAGRVRELCRLRRHRPARPVARMAGLGVRNLRTRLPGGHRRRGAPATRP